MTLKKGDFIKINYSGRIDDSEKLLFDTTEESVAKKEGIYDKKTSYGAVIIPLGEGYLLPGLDRQLEGKDIGKHTFHIKAEEGFGKKDAKKLQLVPMKLFKRDGLSPHPGLQINVDGQVGVVKNVSGGRVIVDFNHPLSSKDLLYEVDVQQVITDTKEKVESIFSIIGLPATKIEATEEKAIITTPQELPEQITKPLSEDIKRLSGVKEVVFETAKKSENKVEKKVEKKPAKVIKKSVKKAIDSKKPANNPNKPAKEKIKGKSVNSHLRKHYK